MPRGVYIKSEEHKRKLSIAKLGSNHPNWGKHLSEETSKKISESHKGKKFTEEHKRKIGEAHKGKTCAQETKNKMSRSHEGEKAHNWKGENAGKNTKHIWVVKHYGNPLKCEDCGKIGKVINKKWNIDWSNKDHKYRRIREDYRGRCKKCHRIYDRDILKIKIN